MGLMLAALCSPLARDELVVVGLSVVALSCFLARVGRAGVSHRGAALFALLFRPLHQSCCEGSPPRRFEDRLEMSWCRESALGFCGRIGDPCGGGGGEALGEWPVKGPVAAAAAPRSRAALTPVIEGFGDSLWPSSACCVRSGEACGARAHLRSGGGGGGAVAAGSRSTGPVACVKTVMLIPPALSVASTKRTLSSTAPTPGSWHSALSGG
jgi:hypothetical protein